MNTKRGNTTHLETLKLYQRWRTGDDERTFDEIGITGADIGEALNWAIRELDSPDWVQAGDNTLHGAIDHWQAEATRLAAENEALRVERDEALAKAEFLSLITPGDAGWTMSENEDLMIAYEQAAQVGDFMSDALESMLSEWPDEGQAQAAQQSWAERADPERYRTVLKRIDIIKASGAREALQRATVKPGFSKLLVRIDTMLEVIEQMEVGE